MGITLDQITAWILEYRYILLFPLASVEGPIVGVVAGFACSIGLMDLRLAYPILIAADVLPDAALYAVGRFAGLPAILRWGRRIGITSQRLERFERALHARSFRTLLAGKLMHGVGVSILIAAGVARLRFRTFLAEVTAITIPKALTFLLLGYVLGDQYASVQDSLDVLALALVAGVVVVGLLVLLGPRLGRWIMGAARRRRAQRAGEV